MFEGAVQALIRRYAREYLCVDDASLDGLVVSLWSGHMEIEDLELEPHALQQVLGLDLRVAKSKIGRLSVDVPWSKLQSKPVVIRLTGIEIEAEQVDASNAPKADPLQQGHGAAEDAKDPADALRERVEAKMQRLAQLERIETAAAQADDGSSMTEGSSFWMKLATKILDNLQLVLQDIRISVKSTKAQAEVHIDEVALLSVDANWHEAFVSGADVMRKIARIRNPRVLVGPVDDQGKPMLGEIFRQRSIVTKITLRKGPSGPNGTRVTEGVEVHLAMEATRVTVERDQVLAIGDLQPAGGSARSAVLAKANSQRRRLRETKWERASRLSRAEAQQRLRERKREAWFKACREPYLELFKRTLEATRGWLPDLSTRDRERLELMEKSEKLTFAHIVRLRRIAYEEVRMRVGGAVHAVQERRDDPEVRRRRAEARAKAEQAQKGWLSSWWGGGSKNESKGQPEEASLEAVRAEVTDEERNRLFETIGYDPNLEEDDIVDLTKMHLQLSAAVASVDVRIGPSDEKAARAHLGEVRCSVDFQGSLQAVDLVAESLVVQDDFTPNTLFRSVIGPAVDAEASADVPHLLVVKVGRKDGKRHGPLVVDCHLDQPVRLVYSAPLVEHILETIKAPENVSPPLASGEQDGNDAIAADDWAPLDGETGPGPAGTASPSAWDAYYAAYTGSTIEEMVDLNSVPSVSVRIQTPRIVVPASVTEPGAPRLELRLGAFDLSQHSQDTWHLEGSNILAKVERDDDQGAVAWTQDLLSDVSFHSSLVLCTSAFDANEKPQPRVDVGVEVPAVRVQVDSDALDAVLTIAQSFQQGTDSDALVEDVDGKDWESEHETESDADSISLPSDAAVLERLAARIAFRFRAHLDEASVRCDLPHLRTRVSLNSLKSTYVQRTFDGALDFEAGSFSIKDLASERDIWSPQEGSELVRLELQTLKPQSPIFEGYTRSVSLKVGAVRVNFPTSFVQGIYSTMADLSQRTAGTATRHVHDVKTDVKDKAKEKKPSALSTEERYKFSAEALEVKFLRDDNDSKEEETTLSPPPPPYLILSCEIEDVEAEYTTSATRARVRSLRAVTADRELFFLSGDQTSKDEDMLIVHWTAEEGAVLEMDPMHLVLDQKVFRALLAFKPPASLSASSAPPREHTLVAQTSSAVSSSSSLVVAPESAAAEDAGASSGNGGNVQLKLRRPNEPFVIEFLAADGPTCEARAKGLRAGKSGVFLEGISVILDGSHEVMSLEEARFDNEAGLVVERVQAILNPETRRLAHTLTDAARSVVELAGGASSQPSTSGSSAPMSQGEASTLQVLIKDIRVITRDVANEGGVILLAQNIGYKSDTVSLGGLSLFDEDSDTRTDMLKWESEHESGIMEVFVGGSSVRGTGHGKANFCLTPTSQAVATTLGHTMQWCGNAVQELMGGGGSSSDSNSSNQASEEIIFELELPGVVVDLESFRPKLGNLQVRCGTTGLTVHGNGKIDVDLDDVEFLSSKFPLHLSISSSEPGQLKVNVDLEKALSLRADPRSIYQLNSALNSNLLLPSDARPRYELASEDSTALMLELRSKQILLELERPPVEGTDESEVEHFASLTFSGLAVNFDGMSDSLDVKSSMVQLDSHVRLRPSDPPVVKSVATITQASVSMQTRMEGELHQTELFVDAQTARLSHEPKLLRAIFEFQSILESLRTTNILLRELEPPSKELQTNKSVQTRVCIKELSVKVAPEDVPGVAIVLRSEVIAIVESKQTETQLERVVRLTVANTSCGLCVLGEMQEVTREHSLLDDASVILILRNAYQLSGVRLMSSFVLNVNDVSLEFQAPMLMRLHRVVNATLRTLPSRSLVQRAILSEAGKTQEAPSQEESVELESFDGTKYEVEVTVSGFDAVLFGRSLPLARFRIQDNSIASGETIGSSESISSSAFKGSLTIRSIDVCLLNPTNMAWEPVLEPCDLSSEIRTIPQKPHNGFELALRSSRPLRANVHVDHLRRIMDETEDVMEQMQEVIAGESDTGGLKLSNYRRCTIVNKTDMDAMVNGDTKVPAHGEVAVQTASMRINVRLGEEAMDLALVDRKDQALGSARFGAWVEHIVAADSVAEDGTEGGFVVTLASGMVSCNDCDMVLRMAVLVDGETQVEQSVQPGRRFYIPPRFDWRSCSMVVRLTEDDNWSMVPLQYEADSRVDETLPLALAENSAIMMAEVVRNECRPLCRIHIRPFAVFENELPGALRVQLLKSQGGGEGGTGTKARLEAERELRSGDLWPLYPSDTDNLFVRFAFPNAPEVFGPLVRVQQRQGTSTYLIEDRASRRVQQLHLRASARGLSISAPYWVVNGTGLDLALAREDTMELLDAPVQGSVLRAVEETWENQRLYVGQGWVQRMLPGERPVWSNESGTEERLREGVRLPRQDPGWAWETDWVVDTNAPNAGAGGWMYANALSGEAWKPEESWARMVRRRRWVRTRFKPVAQEGSAGDGDKAFGAASTSTRVFGFDTCLVGLRQSGPTGPSSGSGSRVAWSTPCPLNFTMGTSNVFPMRRSPDDGDKSFYELVMSLSEHPTVARTRLCMVSPRVVLVNQVGATVRVIQANTYQDPIVLSEDPAPLWWHEPLKSPGDAKLQIQLDSSSWSAPFPIHTLDEFCMAVPGHKGRVVVEVRRGSVESTMLVVFRADSESQPMYRIENVSLERIKCTQSKASVQAADDPSMAVDVGPYDSAPFAWIEPMKSHLLQLEIGGYGGEGSKGAVKATVDLTKIGRETRVVLPAQRVTAEDGGAQDLKHVCGGLRHFLSGPGNTRWVARAPPPVAESVLDDVLASKRRAWTLGLSEGQASAIVFVAEDAEDEQVHVGQSGESSTNDRPRGKPLRYGERVQIFTRTSDGLERRLMQLSGTEVGWKLASVDAGISGQETEGVAGSSQAQSQANDPRMWWVLTGKSAGELVELTDSFGVESAPRRDVGSVGSGLRLGVSSDGKGGPAGSQTIGLEMPQGGGDGDSRDGATFGASALRNIRSLESRTVFVIVDVDAQSRVVRIMETSLGASAEGGDSSEQQVAEMTRVRLSVDLSDVGISVISRTRNAFPSEVIYVTGKLSLRFHDTNLGRALDFTLQSLRIDNCLDDPTYANLLKRSYVGESPQGLPPVLSFSMSEKHTRLNVRYIRSLSVRLAKMDVQIDENFISACKEMATQVSMPRRAALLDAGGPSLTERRGTPKDVSLRRSMDLKAQSERGLQGTGGDGARYLYVRTMTLGKVELRISYFRSKVTDLEGAPVVLDPFEREHLATTRARILDDIRVFYRGEVQGRVLRIIGYALPGNPGELLSALGTNPGSAMHAALASIGSLGTAVAKVDLDYKKKRDAKPRGLEEGFSQGGKQVRDGFKSGFAGLLSKPREGHAKGGALGAVEGVGSGLYGLFAKPVSGMASAVASTSEGFAARSKPPGQLESERQLHVRTRPRRLFPGVQGGKELVTFDMFRTCLISK
ncbi:Vacuolar protein sorting-associated protein 13A [Hondaea fermentalgiana]|uniref:Vacuolar protein sorting-associated protein 13A n=1 Tax=Hondaea fermentalgiana TaxID=2315210 RepID=A0A2R5GLD1_9STRA|nr:Vacuolar protein sorting-associated protein 13A [Hondaea fermentalgiana]|eukprot:GBG29433.1 Vacuolar protein sorting-associated protein 13A [Hondaea fermentalgiana]